MSGPPPPPPPHGEGVPKSSGLPPGKYDIFVIPEHSAGSGFLYLPSLQPNINSFVAGFASALILVVLGQSMAPAFRTWWDGFQGLGNMGIIMLIMGVGFGAWSLGRTQQDGHAGSHGPNMPGGHSRGSGSSSGFGGTHGGTHQGGAPTPDGPPPPPPPHGSPPPNTGPPPTTGGERQKPTWESQPPPQEPPPSPKPPPQAQAPPPPKPQPPPPPKQEPASSAKNAWQRAREETKRKEEERKAKEAEQKRREEATRRLAELRAKEARERQAREAERLRKEKEAKDAKDKLEAEQRAKEMAELLERERKERERLEKAANEAREREEKRKKEKEEAEERSRKGSSYAYSGVGEKTSMWPNGRPPVPTHTNTPSTASKSPPSPEKKPPAPTARTYVSVDEETHSYRPYDKPRRKKSMSSMTGSESSWAQSHTTARTSPPPSMRGPYSTKDPDKIVISAVYLFMNQYAKTPASQLISGAGSVTDGLILRITTEGLFIDDDVRGVPQREWDVKAWTLKNVETGEWKAKGLHVLRATIRDQEGKRYLFVIDQAESWKVATGIQRLKRGNGARQLAVGNLSASDARGTLELLGWAR